jgi:hypothetical protein
MAQHGTIYQQKHVVRDADGKPRDANGKPKMKLRSARWWISYRDANGKRKWESAANGNPPSRSRRATHSDCSTSDSARQRSTKSSGLKLAASLAINFVPDAQADAGTPPQSRRSRGD